jgi:hypothetical protein
LYCDYETDRDTLNARVAQIARGAGIPAPDIGYLHMEEPFADCVEWLLSMVQANEIGLVIVDSVEMAMAGSVSAGAPPNEGPSKINRGLRRMGISALLVDHISAEQAQSKEVARKAYGNVFKRNWQRSSFQLKQSRDPGGDGLRHLGLFNTKRNNGKEFDPVGLDPELEQALPTADRIAAYLKRAGPSQPSAISEETGIPSGTVRPTLGRRVDLFMKNGQGLWTTKTAAVRAHEEVDDEPDELPF